LSKRRLASSRTLIWQETGRNSDTAQVGLGFTDRRPCVYAAFPDEFVIIPIHLVTPVRKLPGESVDSLPWDDLRILSRRSRLGYTEFDITLAHRTLRVGIAKQWDGLIEDMRARVATASD
jgi:hypothetical protein